MKFFLFHLMPWPHLPADFEQHHKTSWIWCSNSFYDPKKGHQVYNDYLDQLEAAEKLGFDGVCVNEHHQTAYGHMPSPNIIAAALARRTEKIKIAIIGNALPLYDPPQRVAEEIAMLDVITNGRIISGQVVGGGPEYYSFGINPSFARERFYEAHELIMRIWTEDGPFSHYGKHFKLKYVNSWPKPLQQPHPPIWIPGAGSLETMDWVAKKRYAFMGIPYFHIDVFRKNFNYFREATEKNGYTAKPSQLGWLVPIYVAETDDQARKEFEPHLWYFIKKLLKGLTIIPPGYTSAKSMAKIWGDAQKNFLEKVETWEEILAGGYAIVGSPETVCEKLIKYGNDVGFGNLLSIMQFGDMPHEKAMRNMNLFATEVMPKLRQAFPQEN
ncbi:MAG: LLM class flavin-dependent oxidoreductase [Blastocatellia bacterium]|nr:LLM class flavin-dependent oxidoreductase [Blastocatellia bacterium]MBN8723705.1 LLM class flavin-dependent oxidoreductase [Acidobacteriota bacterium]